MSIYKFVSHPSIKKSLKWKLRVPELIKLEQTVWSRRKHHTLRYTNLHTTFSKNNDHTNRRNVLCSFLLLTY